MLHVFHHRLQIAPADIDIDPAREPCVFAFEHWRAIGDLDISNGAQRDLCAAFGDDGQVADVLDRITNLARIAHIDRETLQAFHRFANVVAADGRRDHALHIRHIHAVTGRNKTIDVDIDITPAGEPLRQCRRDAGHIFDDAFNLAGDAVDFGKIGTGYFDTHRALDAGGEHINAIADGWNPQVGEAG